MSKSKIHKDIIGKTDIIDFPLFDLWGVPVKIDSGAYTSTIHCSKITPDSNGIKVVFLSKNDTGYNGKVHFFKHYRIKKVRSSNGSLQERFIIKGNILLFGKEYETEFTLSIRDLMRFPVLLGRKLLSSSFIIDTSLVNQSYKINKQL